MGESHSSDFPRSDCADSDPPMVGELTCNGFRDPLAVRAKSTVVDGRNVMGLTGNYLTEEEAALKLQKVYRSYRTRRRLADSAVVAEELWWRAIESASLNQSTIMFFNFSKPETPASRWNRVASNASKVGKGLSKDAKALKLAFQHWIEAIDPRHRYGHSLHLYYEEWRKAEAGQPFFYWLDIGDGKDVDLDECPRSKLRKQCIKYLGPKEREHYEYVAIEGKIIHKESGDFLDTKKGSQGSKMIFVMSTAKKLYAGEKKKGVFHHSSFLAGGATVAAGRLEVEHGVLKAYSGHYRPTDDRLDSLLTFLLENGVNLNEVEIHKPEDSESYNDNKSSEGGMKPSESAELVLQTETRTEYKRTLSGGMQSPRTEISRNAILERINSKKMLKSYQLGHQLSLNWTTGAGRRIGCVADYPVELRLQALEFVDLSPRISSTHEHFTGLASPAAQDVSQT